jgi:hypothetical protein
VDPQRRLGIWAYSLIVLCSIIFWFASMNNCSRSAFQYHGLPSTEVIRQLCLTHTWGRNVGRCSITCEACRADILLFEAHNAVAVVNCVEPV